MKSISWCRGIRVGLALLFVAGATQLCTAQSSGVRATKSTIISVRVLGSVGLTSGAAVLSANLPSTPSRSQTVSVPANVHWNLPPGNFQSFEVVQYVSGADASSRRVISTEQRQGRQSATMLTPITSESGTQAGLLNVEVRLN